MFILLLLTAIFLPCFLLKKRLIFIFFSWFIRSNCQVTKIYFKMRLDNNESNPRLKIIYYKSSGACVKWVSKCFYVFYSYSH